MKSIIMGLCFLTSFALTAQTPDCGVKTTSYFYDRKEVLSKEEVCIHKNKANSRECINPYSERCFVKIEKDVGYKLRDLMTSTSSPGFNLCHKINGLPQLYAVEIRDGVWREYERCLSQDKKQFVDIADLMDRLLI
jgi:hypothetical protein